MPKSTKNLRRGRSCVFLLHTHLVFVTKYRKRVFTKRVLKELRSWAKITYTFLQP
ncbi:hypothetical protein NEPTK9_000444 [Candidatus Neptunochlamydia vexilliferae]|uniref:Transposase IS200-like domain-containing protein n=1 Tax=Candidatus Neptunichlamydia vexilliferae TaxID=1651774 RepID=A0ABS0AY99_9BACT|nr:hypothetical protein [Candidatus Neptunochlamydia vexilliferae]